MRRGEEGKKRRPSLVASSSFPSSFLPASHLPLVVVIVLPFVCVPNRRDPYLAARNMRAAMPRVPLALALALALAVPAFPAAHAQTTLQLGKSVVLRGAAVEQTPGGYVGSTATFTVTAATNGSGHVFLDTFPLTEVDMQGSARLAARVAAQVSGKDLNQYDLFFVIRSGSTQIGGPSAGATLTVGAIAALNNWDVRPDVLDTGTIQPDGSIGPVGGIPEKAAAAAQAGVKKFLFPEGEETQPLSSQPGVTVDMVTYCRQQLDIECVPVADIYQVVENMTDHAFVRPPVTGDVTGAAFKQKLAPLAQQLIDAASTLVDQANKSYSGLVGCRRGVDPTTDPGCQLLAARTDLSNAQAALANGTAYDAASLSFGASVSGRYVRDVQAVGAGSTTVNALYDHAKSVVDAARAQIAGKPVTDTSAFETTGAAQVRVLEAQGYLDDARSGIENRSDPASVVYDLAWAVERANTATWWLKLGADAPPGKPVNETALDNAANDDITSSEETVAYVNAVFASASVGTSVAQALQPAQQKLDEAQTAQEQGFHAAAILDALEAQVTASNVLILASFGNIPDQRVEQARVEAARSIEEARGRGVEPILAESQYEFALSQPSNTDKANFFGTARVTANLAGLPDLLGTERSTAVQTRFQGIPQQLGIDPTWIVATFAIGMALGVGLGLTALAGSRRREPRVPMPPPAPPEFEW
jgi:uncharacterized protein